MSSAHRWQFWIDVGGTFTDSLARSPNGQLIEQKVLSSGLTQGRFSVVAHHPHCITIDPAEAARWGESFWEGAALRIVDPQGVLFCQARVRRFDHCSGVIEIGELTAASWDRLVKSIEAVEANDSTGDTSQSSSFVYELDHGWSAPILAIRKTLQLGPQHALPPCHVCLGTTRGTNALLTRRGAKTALVTTGGLRDLLTIGDQARPHLFELTVRKLRPLCETAIEIDERVLADGTVEHAPDPVIVRRQLSELRAAGIESLAVCLMHGYQFPQHEQVIGEVACKLGFEDVRLSHRVAPLIKILARSETTVLDAYLNPVLGRYLDQIANELGAASELELMSSAGGLVSLAEFSGKDSVLSGPAGGIVGAARVAEQIGQSQVLTFDMGGTSSDVGRFAGSLELEYETRKSGVRIMTPMVAIETVAAGGGSICRFDGTKLVVGPDSATADPGPACYGRGGPLAVTDLNLFLGRIVADRFPFPLDHSAVERRLEEVRQQMKAANFELNHAEIAAGFLAIANRNMAAAIGQVSIARGYDPREHLLVAFGGAGPQHCCAVADELGIQKILDHPQGSILSAVGIRLADQTSNAAKAMLTPFSIAAIREIVQAWCELKDSLAADAPLLDRADGTAAADLQYGFLVDLRYQGTEAPQTITWSRQQLSSLIDLEAQTQLHHELVNSFTAEHRQRFGFATNRPLEVVAVRVERRQVGQRLPRSKPIEPSHHESELRKSGVQRSRSSQPIGLRRDGQLTFAKATIVERSELQPGDQLPGPAIVTSTLSTTIVDDGWTATMLADRQLLLEKVTSDAEVASPNSPAAFNDEVDPVQLEIFNSHFSTIARQMGISLQRTSMSVNVKERLDFSCAIFTADGDLVVNAPHIPVHLGAMSETVRSIIRLNPSVVCGDVFVTNDPFAGGSHLPDITVVTPVFDVAGTAILFWVASRSHHAEIGGISPGSMPPNATCLAEEGVLIRNFKLVDGQAIKAGDPAEGERFDALETLLTASPYPSRSPAENLADLRAQVAANRSGQRDLLALVQRYSEPVVSAYMRHIQAAAERKIRTALAAMPDGEFAFSDSLDNGATIAVAIKKIADQIAIDFAGTDPVLGGNLNANPAIVASAVIYVMRCLIIDDIPLNEGVMKPVTIRLPECLLNPPHFEDAARCPAVVGGNVETSQRVVDVLIGAMQGFVPDRGLAAASQGTMNNWLMGDETFGYYETVGGGAGATHAAAGADAIHTHMTNTRLTDPEILETRYPAILREFAVRLGSGGTGHRRGGDGMIREIEFRRSLTLSLLTNRRTSQPYGLLGGQSGAAGRNVLRQVSSHPTLNQRTETELPSSCELQVNAGDRLRLETPGGGGWGQSSP